MRPHKRTDRWPADCCAHLDGNKARSARSTHRHFRSQPLGALPTPRMQLAGKWGPLFMLASDLAACKVRLSRLPLPVCPLCSACTAEPAAGRSPGGQRPHCGGGPTRGAGSHEWRCRRCLPPPPPPCRRSRSAWSSLRPASAGSPPTRTPHCQITLPCCSARSLRRSGGA